MHDADWGAVLLQWRRKQFTVLMHHIRDMQKSMEDESDEVG